VSAKGTIGHIRFGSARRATGCDAAPLSPLA
jgi:hypothetical protein